MSKRSMAWPVAAAVVLGALACTQEGVVGTPETAPQLSDEQVQTVIRTSQSGLNERTRTVLRSQEAWEEAWSGAFAPFSPTPAVPPLDFDSRMVVLAAMGGRSTGGFSIEITSVRREGEDFHVEVREVRPGPRCFVTQAVTAPVHAVAVPRVGGTVHFVETEVTRDC